MAWFLNVQDGGATGDGTTDDRAAIQGVLNSGSLVVFPSGTYKISSALIVPSNTWICGVGSNSVVKLSGSGDIHFRMEQKNNIKISNIKLLHESPQNFCTCIYVALSSSNIEIDSCYMEVTGNIPDTGGNGAPTLHAVLFKEGAEKVFVHHCQSKNMQFKIAGSPPWTRHIVCTDNLIETPLNLGISLVTNGSASLTNFIVSRNIILDPRGNGGIFMGSDGSGVRIRDFKHIKITENIVSGTFSSSNGVGLIFHPGEFTEDIIIANNQFIGDNSSNAVIGLKVDTSTPEGTIKNVLIQGNQIRGFEQGGIICYGGYFKNFNISDNMIWGTKGVRLSRGWWDNVTFSRNHISGAWDHGVLIDTLSSGDFINNLICTHNQIYGSAEDGLKISAVSGSIISGLVSDNIINSSSFRGIAESGPGDINIKYLDNDIRDNNRGSIIIGNKSISKNNLGE